MERIITEHQIIGTPLLRYLGIYFYKRSSAPHLIALLMSLKFHSMELEICLAANIKTRVDRVLRFASPFPLPWRRSAEKEGLAKLMN